MTRMDVRMPGQGKPLRRWGWSTRDRGMLMRALPEMLQVHVFSAATRSRAGGGDGLRDRGPGVRSLHGSGQRSPDVGRRCSEEISVHDTTTATTFFRRLGPRPGAARRARPASRSASQSPATPRRSSASRSSTRAARRAGRPGRRGRRRALGRDLARRPARRRRPVPPDRRARRASGRARAPAAPVRARPRTRLPRVWPETGYDHAAWS